MSKKHRGGIRASVFAASVAAVVFGVVSIKPAMAQSSLAVDAISTGSHVHAVADPIFNGLVGLDQNLAPVPDLATSWSVSEDGKPFTSADVKFSFEQILFKFRARTKVGLGAVVESIDTPDPRTAAFRLKSAHRDDFAGFKPWTGQLAEEAVRK